jgi:hypothetical protein
MQHDAELLVGHAAHCVPCLHAGAHPPSAPNAGQLAAGNAGGQDGTRPTGAAAPVFEWESSGHPLTRGDIERYSRQLILPALGVQGAHLKQRIQK